MRTTARRESESTYRNRPAHILRANLSLAAPRASGCGATPALALSRSEPLYIVELGAGSGKFSFYMLQALNEMQDICDFPLSKVVYVMTDFTESNFKFWKDHPGLAPFIAVRTRASLRSRCGRHSRRC